MIKPIYALYPQTRQRTFGSYFKFIDDKTLVLSPRYVNEGLFYVINIRVSILALVVLRNSAVDGGRQFEWPGIFHDQIGEMNLQNTPANRYLPVTPQYSIFNIQFPDVHHFLTRGNFRDILRSNVLAFKL